MHRLTCSYCIAFTVWNNSWFNMKITCGVEIKKRLHPVSNATHNRKYSVATVALCHCTKRKTRQDADNVILVICTHENPRGTKYKLYNNVVKLFTKFGNDGKATIRFKDPEHDLIISEADPLELKGFLHGVGLTADGKGNGKTQFSPPPAKVDPPKTMLIITEKSQYPPKNRYPSSLTLLCIQHCSLTRLDSRILRLHNLQVLDLAYNNIKALPVGLADLNLKKLVLDHNRIESFPTKLCAGMLGQHLEVLDLSFNKISELSPYFCLMKRLHVLFLRGNRLSKLPRNFQCLESLRMFSASRNYLKVLPYGIHKCVLESLDLLYNPLNAHVILKPDIDWEVPTLLECAAKCIADNRIPYEETDLPVSMMDYLVDYSLCPCSKKVFQNKSLCILELDLFPRSTLVYTSNTSRFSIPTEVYFCSEDCWQKFFNLRR